ncbi:MAG TPA: hypothetical protein VF288_04180 [Mycobacteriales bacterium]
MTVGCTRHAGVERTPERKPPSIEEVERVAAAIEPRYRVLVVLAAWSGLRWGELAALSRQRIDRLHGVIQVEESMIQRCTAQTRGRAPIEARPSRNPKRN